MHDRVGYVIATQHRCEPRALYLPSEGLLISRSDDDAAFIAEHFGGDIATWLGAFVLRHAPDFVNWLTAPARKPLLILREAHIGHHLWNELSGLHDLLAHPAIAARPPDVLVCNHTLSEMWGELESIFPELDGRVSRGGDGSDLAVHCLQQHILPLRPSASRVPKGLSARIRATMARGREIPKRAHPIVLFNPRTENRTATDLVSLFEGLAGLLLDLAGPITIVIDGHNENPSAPTGTWLGVHWNRAELPPLEAERAFASALRERLVELPIEIVDTLGQPLAASIVWASAASFHISIWGAGLAKSAWIAGLPGLAITSQWNLRNRHDLHIYDNEEFVELPPMLLFPNPDDIEDCPNAKQLVPIKEPRFWNFTLEPASLREKLQTLLAQAAKEN